MNSRSRHNFWMRTIAALVVCLFLVNDFAFAIPQLQNYILAPPCRFKPIFKIVNGIREVYEIKADMTAWQRKNKFVNAISESKGAKTLFNYKWLSSIYHEQMRNMVGIYWSSLHNSFDAIIDKMEEMNDKDFNARIMVELYEDNDEVVVVIIDNGKTIELKSDGTPEIRIRDSNKHFGGRGGGIKATLKFVKEHGGTIKWYPLKDGTKTQVRIPKKNMPPEFQINKHEYIYIENEQEKANWDDELIRVIKEGEKEGRQSVSGKHFVNSVAFYVISKIIGDDLYNPIELKGTVTQESRAKALSKLIRENIDPVELAMSKTHHDPILKGFEIDKLRYNEDGNAYELPIYREGVENLYYKFYIAKEPKNSDDWKMMPVGDGKHVYVRVEQALDSPIRAHGRNSLKVIEELVRKKREELTKHGIKRALMICLDGDSGVGKTTLSKYLCEKLGFSAVELDDYIDPTDPFHKKNWQGVRRGIESLEKDGDVSEILVDGMRALEAEHFGHIAFDIKIKVIADEKTRRSNLKEKSPDYYSDTDINRLMLCRAEYPAIKGVNDQSYDLIIESSKGYRIKSKPASGACINLLREAIKEKTGASEIIKFCLPYDHLEFAPIINEMVKAFRDGKVVALDLQSFSEISIERVDHNLRVFSDYLADEFSSASVKSSKLSFAIYELLKNALVHGNKVNFNLPIFLYIRLSSQGEFEAIEVYDTATENINFQGLEKARDAGLYGKGGGLKRITWSEGWGCKIENIPNPRYGVIGTCAVAFRGTKISPKSKEEVSQNLDKETAKPFSIDSLRRLSFSELRERFRERRSKVKTQIIPDSQKIGELAGRYFEMTANIKNEYELAGNKLPTFHFAEDLHGDGLYAPSPLWFIAICLGHMGIGEADSLLEVGGADGKLACFISHLFKNKTTSVEIVPEYHDYAVFQRDKLIKRGFIEEGQVNLINKCFTDESIDFSKYSIIYYYTSGTRKKRQLAEKFLTVKKGCRIVIYGQTETDVEALVALHPDFKMEILALEDTGLPTDKKTRVYTRIADGTSPKPDAEPIPQGTPVSLIRYMFVNNVSEGNPKTVKEMAQEWGLGESIVYRGLRILRGARLIGGGKENLYYLTDWVLELNPEDFEEILKENRELSKPDPSDEEVEEVCIRIDRAANIQTYYPTHDEWIAAKKRFYENISENGKLVEDLRRLGYSIDDAIDAIFTKMTYNVDRGFGVGQYSTLEPELVHQHLLIEADLESLIRHRLSRDIVNRDFVIYGLGIGEMPHEAVAMLKTFYNVLEKLHEDPRSWNVRFIGFDVDRDIIRNTKMLFKPINEKRIEVSRAVLGIEDANIKAEFYQVNLYDVIELGRVLHEAGLEDIKADYILSRYLNYENWEIEKGSYDEDISLIKDRKEKSLEKLTRIIQAYITYRNSLLILGRPKQANNPGTRYVIDPNQIRPSGGRVLIPPGTDFIGLEALGVLEYEDQDAVENAGLLTFKESVRSVSGISENETGIVKNKFTPKPALLSAEAEDYVAIPEMEPKEFQEPVCVEVEFKNLDEDLKDDQVAKEKLDYLVQQNKHIAESFVRAVYVTVKPYIGNLKQEDLFIEYDLEKATEDLEGITMSIKLKSDNKEIAFVTYSVMSGDEWTNGKPYILISDMEVLYGNLKKQGIMRLIFSYISHFYDSDYIFFKTNLNFEGQNFYEHLLKTGFLEQVVGSLYSGGGKINKDLAASLLSYERTTPEPEAVERGLEKLQNLWEDARVIEMAKDLKKNRLKNFKKVDEKDVPVKIKNSRNGRYSGLYEYRNGLRIIKKLVKNIDVIKDFCSTRPAGACPAFFVGGDRNHYFELELASLGYAELYEIIHNTKEKVTPEMRVSVRQLIARDFRREGNKWFRHGHLFPKNIFMKVNKAGKLEDIKIIDWKYLLKENPPEAKDFMYLVVEGVNLDGFDLTATGLPAVLVWSSLKNANLRKAVLMDKRLWFNDFRGADLRDTYLSNSDLWLSDLRGADFRGAELSGTKFLDTLMKDTKFDKEMGEDFEAKGFYVVYEGDYCLVTSPALMGQLPEGNISLNELRRKALSMSKPLEISGDITTDREFEVFVNKKLQNFISSEDWKKIIGLVGKNYSRIKNRRSFYYTLKKPIELIYKGKIILIGRIYLKGLLFDAKKNILPHADAGSVTKKINADRHGIIHESEPIPSPDGGARLEEALREFLVTNEMYEDERPENKIITRIPIGWVEFQKIHFKAKGSILPMGCGIFGIYKEVSNRYVFGEFGDFKAKPEGAATTLPSIAEALRELHSRGITHPYLHNANFGENFSVFDLGKSKTLSLDKMTPQEFFAEVICNLRYLATRMSFDKETFNEMMKRYLGKEGYVRALSLPFIQRALEHYKKDVERNGSEGVISYALTKKIEELYERGKQKILWETDDPFLEIIKSAIQIERLFKTDEISSKSEPRSAEIARLTEGIRTTLRDIESEQTHAVELARTIKHIQTKPETRLSFIALGTNALYGDKEDRLGRVAINPLISSIRNYCEKKGILFIDGDDDKVAQVVDNIKRDYKEARGVVLAGEKAIDTIETYLKTIGLKDDKNILLAGLNNKNLLTAKPGEVENYIRLVEMLNLTIKLFHKDTINEKAIQEKHPRLGFRVINKRRITFEPDAEPMSYERLRKIYELQEFA